MLKVLHQHIIYESLNHQVTSTVEYVVVLFTGPCDEAARNTECEVSLNQEKGFLFSLFDVSLL